MSSSLESSASSLVLVILSIASFAIAIPLNFLLFLTLYASKPFFSNSVRAYVHIFCSIFLTYLGLEDVPIAISPSLMS